MAKFLQNTKLGKQQRFRGQHMVTKNYTLEIPAEYQDFGVPLAQMPPSACVSCPGCKKNEFHLLFKSGDLGLLGCPHCGWEGNCVLPATLKDSIEFRNVTARCGEPKEQQTIPGVIQYCDTDTFVILRLGDEIMFGCTKCPGGLIFQIGPESIELEADKKEIVNGNRTNSKNKSRKH